ncbi:hydroxysteroid 11-beta-dehydrogenase 1-like protein isoform X2 [Numida meleagris]|uniref:hydroxysteroid 11-beta-dehydrogenase 1-like protein isoform X2 n=1 Tax=Numida meleagris TaxID=8996 RepID=UPI000B3DC76B|nr:hydroxysteroid 11-beta-dehydrogenase 1-like protein isoform X2 [Numida meleagris]
MAAPRAALGPAPRGPPGAPHVTGRESGTSASAVAMAARSRGREAEPAAIWGAAGAQRGAVGADWERRPPQHQVSVPQRPRSPLQPEQLQDPASFPFCRTWRMMRPYGKALCAAGSLAALLAFFWTDTFQPGSLSGARVLLTGASAGIGEQMAYHYAAFGAEIVLTARREAVLQKVMEKCLTLGAKKVFYIPADMSSPSEPDKVVHFAVQKLGGLDYVVLNHIGVSPFQMWSGDVEHTRWLMQVNFFSYVALATAALPALEKSGGSVVVVSSLTGKVPTPFTTSYSATKFALDGFFSSLRHELTMQNSNVSITLCILGLIDTDTALEKTRGKVHISPSPAPEAALAIIRGGAARLHEVFYPRWLWHVHGLWVLLPSPRVLQSFYNYSGP